jgi:copper oxidase (laccase) domain-containing protein
MVQKLRIYMQVGVVCGGIVENTIEAMQSGATWAWLGAAISQPCFEVGIEVKKRSVKIP